MGGPFRMGEHPVYLLEAPLPVLYRCPVGSGHALRPTLDAIRSVAA